MLELFGKGVGVGVIRVGTEVGLFDGSNVGNSVGFFVGSVVGLFIGVSVGIGVGLFVGMSVRGCVAGVELLNSKTVGCRVGFPVGATVVAGSKGTFVAMLLLLLA